MRCRLPCALCQFARTRAGGRHSEQHHPRPSSESRSIKPTPARLRCLAGCHEFSAVEFFYVRGTAARDKAHRDAFHRGGVGFAGVAERGGGGGRGDGRASIGAGLPCCSLDYGGSVSGLVPALYPLRQTCFESPSRIPRTPLFRSEAVLASYKERAKSEQAPVPSVCTAT